MCLFVKASAKVLTVNLKLDKKGALISVLRSRHFFGRLRKSEVPKPTECPAKLGRLRLKA